MKEDIMSRVKRVSRASTALANLSPSIKSEILESMVDALDTRRKEILEANSRDMEAAREMVDRGEMSEALVKRLKIDGGKLDSMVDGIRAVRALEDPVGKTLYSIELDDGLVLYQISSPIGVVGVIFESRPDVVPQIMSLCLKSGNGIVFKGGKEAVSSNRILFDTLLSAIDRVSPEVTDAFQLLETREDIAVLLQLEEYIDMLIPRGSNQFVKYIQDNTRIPVLGHTSGICHLYVDKGAEMEKAWTVTLDSKVQYPAACNAVETILVHSSAASDFLPRMGLLFSGAGVEIRADERSLELLERAGIDAVEKATEEDWRTEHNDLVVSIKIVDSIDEAIDHINTYGSHHTDSIMTEDSESAANFISLVDSSSVMLNASTRFADGYRYGKGAEIGISTNKIHSRGPVGMEGLMIYKYVLIGEGQTVADYSGPGARGYIHRPLDRDFDLRGDCDDGGH